MLAFWIAVALGAVVSIAYLTLAWRSFKSVRGRVLAGIAEETPGDKVFDDQKQGFNWKASGGVLASIAVISGLALGGGWWYLVPFLAIGSAIAVVVAFLYDETTGSGS